MKKSSLSHTSKEEHAGITGRDSSRFVNLLVKRLKKIDPYKIILFGSYAHGNPTKDSDIDLIVVLDKEDIPHSFQEHLSNKLLVRNAVWDINMQVPIDIIVYTKKMYQKFIELGSLFSKEILEEGKVLYEKSY